MIDFLKKAKKAILYYWPLRHPWAYLITWPFVAIIIKMPIEFLVLLFVHFLNFITEYRNRWFQFWRGWKNNVFGDKSKNLFWILVELERKEKEKKENSL